MQIKVEKTPSEEYHGWKIRKESLIVKMEFRKFFGFVRVIPMGVEFMSGTRWRKLPIVNYTILAQIAGIFFILLTLKNCSPVRKGLRYGR